MPLVKWQEVEEVQVTRHHPFSDVHNLAARIFKDVMDSTQLSITYFAPRYRLHYVMFEVSAREREKVKKRKRKRRI